MTTITLIRGLPGSGKSTLAKQLRNVYGSMITDHFEADMFFTNPEGVYTFNPERLGAAHQWCQCSADESLFYKKNVIVSNTFTTIKEMKPYVEMAKKNGAQLNIILCQGSFGNIHSVPEASLDAMKRRFAYDLSSLFIESTPDTL